jgi:transposase
MRGNDFTKILRWPGYRVYHYKIDEKARILRLWARRKRGNRTLICSGCGQKFTDAHDNGEREVWDLPWGEYRTTAVIEVYRVCCPNCGLKVEKVRQLPSNAPFSKLFEEAVGGACESASVRRGARQFRLAASTMRAVGGKYLERWNAARRQAALKEIGWMKFILAS